MALLTFRAFLRGPEPYVPNQRWHPVAALLAALGVIVIGQGVPIVGVAMLASSSRGLAPADGSQNGVLDIAEPRTAWLLLASQVTLVLLTLLVTRWRDRRPADALHLLWPEGGLRAFAYAFVLMVPLLGGVNALAYWLSPEGYVNDFRQFVGIAQVSEPLPAFLAIAAGAPAWEEMLFRGFLLGPLVAGLGFWPGAIAVSAAWTALHLGYSLAGVTEVFVIGLYFAWLLRRTASLWVPIACHAVYNASLFGALRYLVA